MTALTIKIQNKIIWFLIKALFRSKTKFKSIIKEMDKGRVEDMLTMSLQEENYELAAVLKYYLQFKFKDQKVKQVP